MSLYNDIQIIAKTKELTEKLDKVSKIAEAALKETIDHKRVEVASDGSSSKGATGAGDETEGIGPDGTALIGPIAPPPTPADIEDIVNTVTAALDNHISDNNIKFHDNTKSNDLSDSASDGAKGGSGAHAFATGKDINGDAIADWATQEAAYIAEGLTAAEIQKKKNKYLADRVDPGTSEVASEHSGQTASSKITPGSWTSFAPRTQNSPGDYLVTAQRVSLNALVGVDPLNEDLAIVIRLDGADVVPTIFDAVTIGGQSGPWVDADTPPGDVIDPTWQLGIAWRQASPSVAFFPSKQVLIDYTIAGINDVPGQSGATYTGDLEDPGLFDIVLEFDYLSGATPLSTSRPIDYVSCPVTGAEPAGDACALTGPIIVPGATAYPITNTFNMILRNGKFIYNAYDSQVPFYLRRESASVKIKSVFNDLVYDVSVAVGGGFLLSLEGSHSLYYDSSRTLRDIVPEAYKHFYTPL